MKDSTRKILNILLFSAVALLSSVMMFCVVRGLDWPPWVGLFWALLLTGATSAVFFLRQFWIRRRKQRLADDLTEPQTPQAQHPPDRERSDLKGVQAQWQAALDTLRKSHLKKHGNPLYVLPWYLLLGESGTGKTTSLTSATLSSPLLEKNSAAQPAATANCDWWFLDKAVIIDTAGRYAVPVHEERDKEEWRHFLRLLAKYRRREPVNGVVVTVAADRLQEAGDDALSELGRTLRRRIDELMTVLGARFPVYLLVTKCDLIQGFAEFAGQLPEKSLNQALGAINQDLTADPSRFLELAFSTICDRLRTLRLQLLLQPEAKHANPGLLLFPDQLFGLKERIAPFMEAAFGSNQYQETPILRGIYFSSGHHEGSTGGEETGPSGKRGIFLHDFFELILPQDRWIFAPTRSLLQWRRVTGNLGLVSWVTLGVALCGLLTFSFAKNLSTIRQMPEDVSRPPVLRGDKWSDVVAIDSYREHVAAVERKNREWWLPRFGLTASLKVEQELKSRFCRRFQDGILTPFDRSLTERMAALSPSVPDELYGQYIIHSARRINLLKARQAGQGYQALMAMPQPDYLPGASLAGPGTAHDLKAKLTQSYLSYLIWRSDSGSLNRDIGTAQNSLKQLLALKPGDMQWLITWVDRHSSISPVTLGDFWGGSLHPPQEVKVAPAFTRKGKEEIEAVVREIDAALSEQRMTGKQRKQFEQLYRPARLAAWEAFAAAFPRGSERLKGEREWQEMAVKMATDQNPYFALVNRMMSEIEPEMEQGELPVWLKQLSLFQLMKSPAPPGENKTVSKASESGKKLLVALERKVGQEASAQTLESRMGGAQAYREYLSALSAIAPAAASRTQAYQAAVQLYSEDPAVGKSPFITGLAAGRKVGEAVAAGNAQNQMVGRLIGGPLDFLWKFVRQQASGHLQSQWEEQVLAGTLGMTDQQAAPVLLGQDGLVWKFVKGPAAPFLSRSLRGYRPKEVLGNSVQFDRAFFSFLERGSQVQAAAISRQSNYSVGIQGLPTDANAEARVRPHATRLELQCGGSSQTLANQNYPAGKTFNWSPDNCGDVLFQIEVGDLVLTRRYLGPQSFPEFLQSFPGGQRVFHPADFPGEKPALERMGIRYIKVNYQFIGSGPVVRQLTSACGQVPRNIARCWNF